MTHETVQTDVLIIGGGGGAGRAAYEAKRFDPRLDVTLVVAGPWGSCGSTVWVASETLGINAPLNGAGDGDSPEVFLEDIIKTGLGLANPQLVSKIAFESSERISELISLGVKFDSVGEKIRQRKLSGCTKSRSLSQGGQTGVAIVSALKKASLEVGVRVLEGMRVVDLIYEDGEVWGAKGLRRDETVEIMAKAVVLANGGAGALFPHNINHPTLLGDGYGMAYRAGAVLSNLEFIQIGPGVVFPKMPFIIHSHMWNFSPRLRNGSGKEFLGDYLPGNISKEEVLALKSMSFPFSVRTHARYVDISISKEVMAGRGTDHGGVFFDVNHVSGRELRDKAPITYQTFMKNGVDLCTDSVEIAPLVQSFNGGVKIDENAATNVPGLFAVGEVSGGVHGADRPGGNNLADCQVFGYRGGRAAAALASERPQKFKGDPRQEQAAGEGRPVNLGPIREAMDKGLMVVRSRSHLLDLLEKIEAFRRASSPCSLTTENLLLTAEMVCRSVLLREESRGIHYREDFPNTTPAFERPSLIRRGAGGEMEATLGPAVQ